MKGLKIAVFVLLSSSICGCFEMSEEIWFNEDGSGRLLIELELSEGMLAMTDEADSAGAMADFEEAELELKKDPNVEEVSTREFSEAGMRHFIFDIKVKDYLKFPDIFKSTAIGKDPDSSEWLEFEVVDLGKGKIRYRQEFSEKGEGAGNSTGGDEYKEKGDEAGKAMMAAMFSDRYIVVTVHAPKIVSSNGEINEGNDTVVWKMPLAEMMVQDAFENKLEAELDCSVSAGDKIKNLFK